MGAWIEKEESIKNIQKTKKMLDEGNNEVYISNKKTIEGIEPYEMSVETEYKKKRSKQRYI